MAYLDRITGTRPSPGAMDAMTECLNMPGANPQSPSRLGTKARQILDRAREQVSDLVHADSREIIFVSNGTESVNLAIRGLAQSAARSRSGRKIVISAIEHVSVMNTVKSLEKNGFQCVVVPVEGTGRLDMTAFQKVLDDDVLLVSVQLANPEIGTVQDLKKIADIAHAKDITVHSDAVDAVGWMPVDVHQLGLDAMSFSGTQFHGPPGGAALFVRKGVPIMPVFSGGLQERHRRPGLENIPAIAGFGVAAAEAKAKLTERIRRADSLAATLRDGLQAMEAVTLTGHPEHRISGHVSTLIHYVEGEALLLMLDMKQIQAASGSSCTAKDLKISPVLTALNIDHASAQGSLVFSTTDDTTDADIDRILKELPAIVSRLRSMSPLWKKQ